LPSSRVPTNKWIQQGILGTRSKWQAFEVNNKVPQKEATSEGSKKGYY